MMTIEINFLQAPTTYIDGQIVHFPYKKAEALFYYLILEKDSNRDQLSALFWCDETEEKAKKNLRQTLYTLKKALPIPIITTTGKSTVSIDQAFALSIDYELALKDATKVSFSGDPFSGFFVKDAEPFDNWLTTTRININDTLIDAINNQMEDAKEASNYHKATQLAKLLMTIDNLDESGYRQMIEILGAENKYYKVQKIFDQMSETFKNEMGINPSKEVTQLYESIINRKKQEVTDQIFFYGRHSAIDTFNKILSKFSTGKKVAVLFEGQPGDGKTMMIQKTLRMVTDDYFESRCYFAEKEHNYRPWQSILRSLFSRYGNGFKLSPLHYQVMTTYFPGIVEHYTVEKSTVIVRSDTIDLILLDLIDSLVGKKRIWLAFDDVQWMDPKSQELLNTVIYYSKGNIGFILGSRPVENARFRDISRQAYFTSIALNPLTKEEMINFVKAHPAKTKMDNEAMERLYNASNGNLFLINSGIIALSDKEELTVEAAVYSNLLKNQFSDLTAIDQKILNGLSMFFSKANLYTLAKLINVDVIDLIDRVEYLTKQNILAEQITDSKIYLAFSHVFIRDHIYSQQSVGKKKIFHEKIASLIEGQLNNQPGDRSLYPNLIYHYERSMNDQKALQYKILNLDAYFNYTHELYPILKDGILEDMELTKDSEDVLKTFQALEKELSAYMITNTKEEWVNLKILLLQMKGRYLIKEGRYSEGLKDIDTMLTLAKGLNSPDFIILGCRQMIYYGIQKKDLDILDEYIQLGMETALENEYTMDYAIFKRLRGVYYLMSERYKLAEIDLKESIETIRTHPSRKYELHVAAALNYLGEIKRKQSDFEEALKQYKEAITIYDSISTTRGLAPILTNMALAYFLNNQREEAYIQIQKAIILFGTSKTVWRKSTAESMYQMLSSIIDHKTYTLKKYEEILSKAIIINHPDEVEFVKSTREYAKRR